MSAVCGAVLFSNIIMAPIACAYKPEHEGTHSWATLPTFGPDEPATQLAEVERLIKSHQEKQNYHQSFGSAADRAKSVLREYEDKTTKAFADVKRVRDDMVTYFRALALVLTMTGEAATHAEKNARLRGAIELLESAIEKLRYQNLESLFDIYHWPDLFRSDWPTRRLMDRIHKLEAEVKELKRDCDPEVEVIL